MIDFVKSEFDEMLCQRPDDEATHASPRLTCEVECSLEKFQFLSQDWDEFVQSVGGDLYMSYDWCRIWWRHFGSGRRLRIYLFRADGKIVGVVPIFYERVWLGPVYLRVAKLVGSDFAMAIAAPPLRPEYAVEIIRSVVSDLMNGQGQDAISFGPLPGTDPSAVALRAACQELLKIATVVRIADVGPHTVFSLPGTFEEYLQSLAKSHRDKCRREMKMLNKSFAVSVDVVSDASAGVEGFEQFRQMHEEQWRAMGKAGHFGDWPNSAEFNCDLIREMAGSGRFHLVRLLANGEAISYQLCYVFGKKCHWRLPARASGSSWNRFGLGRLGLLRMFEVMIGQGIHFVEGGSAHYDYKLQLGGQEHRMTTVLLAADRSGARVRIRLFCSIGNALHLLYYRIWFARIRPRLGFRRKPLWKGWIRSRI